MSILLIGRELICPFATASQSISYELARVLSVFSHKQVKILTVVRKSRLKNFRDCLTKREYFPTSYVETQDDYLNIRHDLSLLTALNKNIIKDVDAIIDINLGTSSSLMPFLIRNGDNIRTIKTIFTTANKALMAASVCYDNVIVTSPLLYGVVSTFPLLRGKVHYIPPPIDNTNFSPQNNKKNQLHTDYSDQTLISYVGPINPKRFALIETLKAMKLLARKFSFTLNIYTFLRYREDAIIFRYLEKKIEKLGLRKNVKIQNILLSKEEKAKIYRSSTLCIFPISFPIDLSDPPISILEAMSCGSVVLTSPVNSIPLIIKDNFNGYTINRLEAKYLSQLIKDIIEYPEKKKIRDNARRTVLDNFSYDAVWKKLGKLIG